jgi:uncharacterized protein YjiS (DUF1127 family)
LSGLKTFSGFIAGLALAASPHSRIGRRQSLGDLDDRLLADVGLSRSDVEPSSS